MTEETENSQDEKMSLLEWWCLPMYLAIEYLGVAGMIIAVPYFIASIAIASAVVIGAVWGSVYALFFLLFY